jgi:hypothetical protein
VSRPASGEPLFDLSSQCSTSLSRLCSSPECRSPLLSVLSPQAGSFSSAQSSVILWPVRFAIACLSPVSASSAVPRFSVGSKHPVSCLLFGCVLGGISHGSISLQFLSAAREFPFVTGSFIRCKGSSLLIVFGGTVCSSFVRKVDSCAIAM